MRRINAPVEAISSTGSARCEGETRAPSPPIQRGPKGQTEKTAPKAAKGSQLVPRTGSPQPQTTPSKEEAA